VSLLAPLADYIWRSLPKWRDNLFRCMFGDDREFENEVRRIARFLWPAAQYGGAVIEDGRERDGLFESDDFVNLVECTVSRSEQKAVVDLRGRPRARRTRRRARRT
jgi:hypothetical protein